MDEELIAQLGLILTQLRYSRRALEDVERSTARYQGLAFAAALQRGPRFGEPPLFGGALKVYVVNINDLAPGGGFGAFLEGLLGGIGRFFGGFLGGVVGGTISGVALPVLLGQMERIARLVDRIIDRILARFPPPETEEAEAAAPAAPLNLESMLRDIRATADTFTALFQAASSGPEAAARTSALPSTESGQRWLQMLEMARGILQGISHVIDGLILLVPIVLGTLALLLSRLDNIKLAILGVLQFVLQNVLLLRGVALTVTFETISAAARMAATLHGILATAVERILASVFDIIGVLLDTSLEAFYFIASGLQRTVDSLLRWATTTLFAVLTTLGDTLVFRVFVHIVQVLPAIIPPLYELKTGHALSRGEREALTEAARRTILPPAFPGTPSAAIPPFPNLAEELAPAGDIFALRATFQDSSRIIAAQVGNIFDSAQGALTGFAQALETTAASGEARFTAQLNERLATLSGHAATLAESLRPEVPEGGPQTGLEAIAQAYEGWLGAGGLDRLLGTITDHFRHTPTAGPGAAGTLPARITEAAAAERPRATIDIEDVVIEVAPPAETATPTPPTSVTTPPSTTEQVVSALLRTLHELEERGLTVDTGSLLTQVSV